MDREVLPIRAMLIGGSCALHTALGRVLARARIDLDYSDSPVRAITAITDNSIPVVLISSDTDWPQFLTEVQHAPDVPSTIVLLNVFDAAEWSRALQHGAFDAVPLNAGQDCLVNAVRSGFDRWERRRLVRTALAQNPYSGADFLQ